MSDCKHKLEFDIIDDSYLEICCTKCNTISFSFKELKDYAIISKADLEELKEMYCPKSYGFEGLGTFMDCGKCVVCRAKQGNL